ncbi:MAG: hypothetical protein IPK44_01640 [Candidatus Accumulibacter sp.]|uniref:hypothetical protein n=1 Tax=Accumulibacter sp. TaxID=2053492 RepID=UPI0025873913|nr:hypothetical protein [Accumulibacter sp.]MBK8113303.1 hypothetical protein [Accumulibacter sp.]
MTPPTLHTIEYIAQQQPDGDTVTVTISCDDGYECAKIANLIKAAPQMYDVLHDTLTVLTACALKMPIEEITLLDNLEALDLNIQRVIAASKGAILQRDRFTS